MLFFLFSSYIPIHLLKVCELQQSYCTFWASQCSLWWIKDITHHNADKLIAIILSISKTQFYGQFRTTKASFTQWITTKSLLNTSFLWAHVSQSMTIILYYYLNAYVCEDECLLLFHATNIQPVRLNLNEFTWNFTLHTLE